MSNEVVVRTVGDEGLRVAWEHAQRLDWPLLARFEHGFRGGVQIPYRIKVDPHGRINLIAHGAAGNGRTIGHITRDGGTSRTPYDDMYWEELATMSLSWSREPDSAWRRLYHR